jgi:antitoxin YefM
MTMPTTMTLAHVMTHLSQVANQVQLHERVVVTRHGQPAFVMISTDELDALEETLEILSDPQLMAGLRESRAERERGEAVRVTSREEFLAAIAAAG